MHPKAGRPNSYCLHEVYFKTGQSSQSAHALRHI